MRAALPSFLLALALAGCAAPPQRIGGQPRRTAPPTVVSLSPSTAEIIAVNFSNVPFVGRTASDDFPKSVLSVPVVAETKPDLEKIQKLKPGLVLYDADLYNEADAKRIEGMGFQTFAFKAHTVEGFEKELFELSGILGNETAVNDNVTRLERARTDSLANPLPTKPKVAVVMGGNYVAGTQSFVADIVRIAGGEPVGPPTDKFDAMSPEAVVAAAPDVIVLPTSKDTVAKDTATLRASAAFAATPAMKNDRLIGLPQDIVLRRGSRVEQFITELHRRLALLYNPK